MQVYIYEKFEKSKFCQIAKDTKEKHDRESKIKDDKNKSKTPEWSHNLVRLEESMAQGHVEKIKKIKSFHKVL